MNRRYCIQKFPFLKDKYYIELIIHPLETNIYSFTNFSKYIDDLQELCSYLCIKKDTILDVAKLYTGELYYSPYLSYEFLLFSNKNQCKKFIVNYINGIIEPLLLLKGR